MEQYSITGMSCAACASRVEKAVLKLSGVKECNVNLLTNSMSVSGNASSDEIINAVQKAGYGAFPKSQKPKEPEKSDKDVFGREASGLKRRLFLSALLLGTLMWFSMGYTMYGLPVPPFFSGNYVALGMLQLLLCLAVMIINKSFFINGAKSLAGRSPNMDTLVALGSFSAFIYSAAVLFLMTEKALSGDADALKSSVQELHFESAAMILTLITVGKMLEERAKGKTANALKSLMALSPKTANVIRNGEEITVPVEDVVINDIFTLRSGESVPVDGEVIEGDGAIDESALTGESIPADKTAGSRVFSATVNKSGFLKCRATRVGEDTTLSQIIKTVSEASAGKAPIARIADKVSGIFVPFVIAVSAVCTAIWLFLGRDIGFALSRGISVLVISCPCALGLATPVAITVGSGVGARHGILFKNASSLENAGKTRIIALDKTGTVTTGKPEVTDVFPFAPCDEVSLLQVACSLEKPSEHPIAGAIMKKCAETDIKPFDVTDFKALSGNGVQAKYNGKTLCGGSVAYISRLAEIPADAVVKAQELSLSGKTPLIFMSDNSPLGMICVADALKSDSAFAVSELKKMGIRVVMLTGDNKNTASAIGKEAGIDEIIAEVLPDGKKDYIERLKKEGKTAMVGDGINDSPALVSADVGIAIGAGTDVAIDSSDIVLMNNSLSDVSAAIKLSRKTLVNIKENLFWAFVYNIIGIPLAAGAFINLFGWELDPAFGAAAMSLSSFCVVTNALRLNFADIKSRS